MRLAYADPPYIGQAKKLYGKYGGSEVNHTALIAELATYDGWALSASSQTLREILPLCPDGVRVAAWVRRQPMFKRGISPIYAWEPVIFSPARKGKPKGIVYDWVVCDPGHGFLSPTKHIIGRKPDMFSWWLFQLMRANGSRDTFYDMFPGSGAVGRAWDAWKMQTVLPIAR